MKILLSFTERGSRTLLSIWSTIEHFVKSRKNLDSIYEENRIARYKLRILICKFGSFLEIVFPFFPSELECIVLWGLYLPILMFFFLGLQYLRIWDINPNGYTMNSWIFFPANCKFVSQLFVYFCLAIRTFPHQNCFFNFLMRN